MTPACPRIAPGASHRSWIRDQRSVEALAGLLRPLGERLGPRLEVGLALEARLGREGLLVALVLEAGLLVEAALARRRIGARRIGLLLEGTFAAFSAAGVAVGAPRLLLERRAALTVLV